MSGPRVLSIGYEPVYEPVDLVTFWDSTSCLDYDVVLWDPAQVLWGYDSTSYRGHRNLHSGSAVRMEADVRRRRREFHEHLALGRTLVVIVRPPLFYYGDAVTSLNDVWSALPLSVDLHAASGSNLQLRSADAALGEFWRAHRDDLRYEAYLDPPVGEVLWTIAGTAKAVGALVRTEQGGTLLLLPSPSVEAVEVDEDEEGEEDLEDPDLDFFLDLLDLVNAVRKPAESLVLPSWTERYLVPGERKVAASVERLGDQIAAARDRLEGRRSELAALQSQKALFTASGRALELAVKDAFEQLGGTVVEPPSGRDDWRVSFPEGDAVVEVKGTKRSAAESHAAQLEKWVAHATESAGRPAKGILVVNGWRDRPLADRTEPVFPSQMLDYSTARAHCLVSGVDLLSLMLGARDERGRRRARRALLETVGVLEPSKGWRDLIELDAEAANGGAA